MPAVIAGLALAGTVAGVAACGEDAGSPVVTSAPDTGTQPATDQQTTTTRDTAAADEGGSTGTETTSPPASEPEREKTPPSGSERDVEGHDVPPPPGSPAERFEQQCERDPESCY